MPSMYLAVLPSLQICLVYTSHIQFLAAFQQSLDDCNSQLYVAHHHACVPYVCCVPCRLPEVQAARTLAGRDNTEADVSFSGRPYVAPAQPGPSSAHFVAECFFLTQRVIHTGLMPAGWALLAAQSVHCCLCTTVLCLSTVHNVEAFAVGIELHFAVQLWQQLSVLFAWTCWLLASPKHAEQIRRTTP